MHYTRDQRLDHTQKRSGLVTQRVGYVNRQVRARQCEKNRDANTRYDKTARGTALSVLVRHHIEESRQLAQEEIARRGLAPHHPFWDASYPTKFDAIEDAVQRGLLHAPVTPKAEALLRRPAHALTHLVAADANHQEDRCAELRHPLLLRGWMDGLEHLRDRHCELAGIEPVFNVALPALDLRALRAMSTEKAMTVINRRRFIRALAQRHRECEMHVREINRAIAVRRTEVEKPWRDAVSASRDELGRRHPEQLAALLAALQPFCVPGSSEIRWNELRKGGPVRSNVVPMLKRALEDGSWRRLLDQAA
jgi:hypothetical protein